MLALVVLRFSAPFLGTDRAWRPRMKIQSVVLMLAACAGVVGAVTTFGCASSNNDNASSSPPYQSGEGPCTDDRWNGHGGQICLYDRCPYSCCDAEGVLTTCFIPRSFECAMRREASCSKATDAGPGSARDAARDAAAD